MQIPFIGQTLEADAMEALFTSGDLVLVDFYKEDCKACLQHAPHFAAVRVGTKLVLLPCCTFNLGDLSDKWRCGHAGGRTLGRSYFEDKSCPY